MLEPVLFQTEAEALKNSNWPKCDALADALASRGATAGDALEFASKSRTHHVRSACLRALHRVEPARGKALATKFVNDRAYEVRETASLILGIPTKDRV